MTVAERLDPAPANGVAAVCAPVLAEPLLRPPRLAALRERDATDGTTYVATLLAYLDSLGNLAAAAATAGVHVNTFRYRLRRLTELSGLDLADPDQRLLCRLDLACPPAPAGVADGPSTTAVVIAAVAPDATPHLARFVAQSWRAWGVPAAVEQRGRLVHTTLPPGDGLATLRRVVTAAGTTLGTPVHAAAGPAAEPAVSHRLAVATVRVGRPGVTAFEEVRTEVALLALRDAVRRVPPVDSGHVARLAAHDAARRAPYLPTLRAYLDAHGDVAAAAARVYVHTKTFRYRLRRIQEISGLPLGDPAARLAAQVELRLRHQSP